MLPARADVGIGPYALITELQVHQFLFLDCAGFIDLLDILIGQLLQVLLAFFWSSSVISESFLSFLI